MPEKTRKLPAYIKNPEIELPKKLKGGIKLPRAN